MALESWLTICTQVGAWTSSNVTNPSKRAAAIGLLMLFGSVGGGSIGSNIYISSEVSWTKKPGILELG